MHGGSTLIVEHWCQACKWPEHREWRVSGRTVHETVSCKCAHDQAFMGRPMAPSYAEAVTPTGANPRAAAS